MFPVTVVNVFKVLLTIVRSLESLVIGMGPTALILLYERRWSMVSVKKPVVFIHCYMLPSGSFFQCRFRF